MQQLESLFGQAKLRPFQFEDSERSWRKGPLAPVIWPNEVHVWKVNLSAPWSSKNQETLSSDEKARAARFRFHPDADQWVAARASMRIILGRYLCTKPADFEFEVNPFGKPRLVAGQNQLGLRFNLSHSHEMALLAVARNRDLGVDIEFIRSDLATDEVAQRFFSRSEVDQLGSLGSELRTEAFFNCWTRKEAYIKARGEGLSLPLDQFDVAFAPDAQPALLDNRNDRSEVSRWSFTELCPASGYKAAIAIERGFSRLLLWDFNYKTERGF